MTQLTNQKRIALLGSTGSVGTQTLDVVRAHPDRLRAVALAADRNVEEAEAQVREFSPRLICMWEEEAAADLRVRIADTDTRVVCGMDGLLEIAAMENSDVLLNAVVGMIGIRPTLAAIEAGKDIALANKETLVTAGHLIIPAVRSAGVRLMPVDSEHSAIFQCLNGEPKERLTRILLTCSGGVFRGRKKEELERMTAADALRHPNWNMGAKITVDSATLVNKGLEAIEAKWFFDVDVDAIEVVIQPQSIIHSMVEFEDGAVMAQLAAPDMRSMIQYALFYPDRAPLNVPKLDFRTLSQIRFEEPDTDTFRGLPLAYAAAHAGGSMPTIFNAANEEVVAHFLKGEIPFLAIYDLIEGAMQAHRTVPSPSLSQVLDAEEEARAFVRSKIER